MARKELRARICILISLFCFAFFPAFAESATMSFSPSGGTYSVGQRINLNIVVESTEPINAVSASAIFPVSGFQIESVSRSGSIIDFWVKEPSFTKSDGIVRFEGVMTSPFAGSNGKIITVVLRAVKEGSYITSFDSGEILANDGEGTNLTESLKEANFTIILAKVTPVAPEPIREYEEVETGLLPPLIEIGKRDGLQSITGKTSYSRADAIITIVSESGSRIFVSDKTDDNGDFNIIVPKSLKDGMYSVSAVIVSHGEQSGESNVISLKVGRGILSVVMQFLALFLIIPVLYIGRKRANREARDEVKAELKEAEEALEKSFDKIKEEVKGGEEVKKIVKDIDASEKALKKEIDDIGSVKMNSGE